MYFWIRDQRIKAAFAMLFIVGLFHVLELTHICLFQIAFQGDIWLSPTRVHTVALGLCDKAFFREK